MKLNLNKFLYSISFALDLAENEIQAVSTFHSKRVAFIAIQLANILKLSEEEKFDLYSYALLHDNGLIEAHRNQQKRGTPEGVVINEDFISHCEIGEKNVRDFPFVTDNKNIILYHHEHYDGSGFYGKKGDEIPLMSQIIFMADIIDSQYDLKTISYETKEEIEVFVRKNECRLFSSQLTRAFLALSSSFSFWGALEYFYTTTNPDKLLPQYEVQISLDEFFNVTNILSNLIDSKSEFTAIHSQELANKTDELLEHFEFDEEHKKKLLISANLHDIGKLATPTHILEKEGSLNPSEVFEIKKHAYFTYTILEGVNFCDDILRWASQHHERPDGSGYPFGLQEDELSLEARIISCLDFYQALVEDRPYRKAIGHERAIILMRDTLMDYAMDYEIIDIIDKVFGNEMKAS